MFSLVLADYLFYLHCSDHSNTLNKYKMNIMLNRPNNKVMEGIPVYCLTEESDFVTFSTNTSLIMESLSFIHLSIYSISGQKEMSVWHPLEIKITSLFSTSQ